MVRRFVPKEPVIEEAEEPSKDLDWNDLADKFNIKGL